MTPIKTIIRNKTNTSKTIHWAGKSTQWLPANGDTVVPFELWSVADDSQKTAIKAAIAAGNIELTVMVLGPSGEYTLAPFSPTGTAVDKKPGFQEVKTIDTMRSQIEEDDHTVRVSNKETQEIMSAYGAKRSKPGAEDEPIPMREVKNGEPEAAEQPKEEPVEAPAQEAASEPVPEVEQAEPKKRKSKKAE